MSQIFSGKVVDYTAARPDYPSELFKTLKVSLPENARIADIGSGTGLFTQGLLDQGFRVVAVEPNSEMREASDQRFGKIKNYSSVHGSAESIPLQSHSIDLVTAAQAFHWFNVDQFRSECLRVLQPNGKVALVWNDRVLEDPVNVALDEIFAKYGGAKRTVRLAEGERAKVPEFFDPVSIQEFAWPHSQLLNEQGLMALVFSRSYMPKRNTPECADLELSVKEMFRHLQVNGLVRVPYHTVAFIGKPRQLMSATP